MQNAIESDPGNLKLAQLYGLSLARLGATDKARICLEGLYIKNERDSETAGLLGRVYKDIWKKTRTLEYAHRSRDIYLKNFQITGDYYPGINAATMSLIVGESTEALRIAEEVIKACETCEKDYWCLSTLGEANLLLGRVDEAVRHYAQALHMSGEFYGDVNSTYQQLRMIARHMDVPKEFLEKFAPPGIVAFSGNMMDHPERVEQRFPESIADHVKQKIAEALSELQVGVGYSSAACGADILFIEAMQERGSEVTIVLPFQKEQFIQTSIRFAGEQWEKRFHNALEKATSVKFVTEEGYFGNDDLFSFAGSIIQGLSTLRAKSMLTTPHLLAVTDLCQEEQKRGGTDEFIAHWPFPDMKRIIDLSQFHRGKPTVALNIPKAGDEVLGYEIPYGIERNLRCILFADVKGFSRLEEGQTPYFMYEFLQILAKKMKDFDPKPEVLNTWGDAIFAIYGNARDMARFAFTLRNMVLKTDWKAKHLPPEMNIRIALHTGPVFQGMDPVLGRPNSYGAHINRAARIEPVTIPGCIYASEQFAANLIVESSEEYALEYVGVLVLPKDFGHQETYHIRKKNEVQ
ncbi:MAG: DUF4071 domain-containing protein [Deltaproteobacteria bacterium]|nr:DUF4071 domain-containing protein [Deltaproteobacteria bacterium]